MGLEFALQVWVLTIRFVFRLLGRLAQLTLWLVVWVVVPAIRWTAGAHMRLAARTALAVEARSGRSS